LIGGVVADRLPRRLVMVSSDSANFVIRATMGALLVSGHAQHPQSRRRSLLACRLSQFLPMWTSSSRERILP
jgi:hypothetical protein